MPKTVSDCRLTRWEYYVVQYRHKDYESAALTAELRAPRLLSRALQATSDYTLTAFGNATMADVSVFVSVLTRVATA